MALLKPRSLDAMLMYALSSKSMPRILRHVPTASAHLRFPAQALPHFKSCLHFVRSPSILLTNVNHYLQLGPFACFLFRRHSDWSLISISDWKSSLSKYSVTSHASAHSLVKLHSPNWLQRHCKFFSCWAIPDLGMNIRELAGFHKLAFTTLHIIIQNRRQDELFVYIEEI